MEALLSESSADESESRNIIALRNLDQFPHSYEIVFIPIAAILRFASVFFLHFSGFPGYSWIVNGIRLEVGLQFFATVSLVLVFLHVFLSGLAHGTSQQA